MSSEALSAACAYDDRSRTHSRRDGASYQPFTACNIQSWFRGEYMQSCLEAEGAKLEIGIYIIHEWLGLGALLCDG